MSKINFREIINSILVTLGTAATLWGATEAITYFTGSLIKQVLGNYWVFFYIILPILVGFFIRHLFINEIELASFILINDDFLDHHENSANSSYFYYGASPTWEDVISGKDIERDLLTDILTSIDDSSTGVTIIPILASAGEGKTTFIKRLAVELVSSNKVVLYRKRDHQVLRVEDVEQVCERFNKHIYILLDDAALANNFIEFIQGLTDQSINATVIAAARPYDWQKARSVYGENVSVRFGSSGNEYSLDQLSNREIEDLFKAPRCFMWVTRNQVFRQQGKPW